MIAWIVAATRPSIPYPTKLVFPSNRRLGNLFAHFAGLVILAGSFALHLEGLGKSRFIHHEPVFLGQVFDDFQRQSAGVVEEERLFSGQRAGRPRP